MAQASYLNCREPLGLLDNDNRELSCSLVDCLVDVKTVGSRSQVFLGMFFQNMTNKDFLDAVLRVKVAKSATISSFDCVVKKSGREKASENAGEGKPCPPRYNLERRAIRNASLENCILRCNVGKVQAGRDVVVLLRYDHNVTRKDGLQVTFRFPLPGKFGENMITRSRKEGNEEVAWNGSHIFSFATIDIEASMPGQITDVSSSTHSLSSTLNWNQAKMSVDNHTLQGEDDFEYTITADHLDSAMDYYYEEVEGGQNTLEVNNLPRNLSHILRQSGNWDKDDFDDLCASETLEKYFNGSLIPQDENVKFNIIPMEQKSLITSKIEIVTLTEREVVPKEEELDDYEDDDVEYEKEEEDEVDNLDDSQDSGPQSFFDAESENEEEDGEQRSIFDPEETADASVEPQSDTIEKSGSSNDKFKDATGNIQPPAIAQGPELNSWFLEDSDDDDDDDDDSVVPEIDRYKDETSSTRECPDLEEDIAGSGEEEEEEYDDDDDVSIVDATLEGIERYAVAPNDNIFVGTALAVNHRRPKLVNIVTTSISNSHRRHRYFTMDGSNNHSDASENYTDSRISPDRWRKRLYTTTFGRSPWTEDLTEILERLYADLEGSSTGFLLLDETLAQIVGVPLEELVEKLDSQIHALSPVASLVKQGAWANLVALSYIRSLEQSHNLEEAGEQAAENFNRLYSHLYVPLLRNQTSYGLPLPLMSEMATDLVLHRNKEPDYFNNSRKLREVAVIGLGVITPPASPPKTPA